MLLISETRYIRGVFLAIETPDQALAADYEAIRRREYTLITDMLSVLPRINNLPETFLGQARDALFHADHPFLMVFVGPFSSGKSSIINALMGSSGGDDLLEVGPVPTTDRISILRYGEEPQRMDSGGEVDTVFYPNPLLKKVSFVDTPGLESVFQKHEETTGKFLHRSDVVMLVMLATQAMTSRNLKYIQTLREYGKKVIILINQADLLTPEEAETVRNYVTDQSHDRLGYKPQVWMVSAKQGKAANAGGERDETLWRESGLNQIEEYVNTQLNDTERLRQKLQTPLQIAQNVNSSALRIVRSNQSVLDQYQTITDNLNQQLDSQKREQEKTIRETTQAISDRFGTTAMRGSEAIREIFQFSNALGSASRGILELTGLGRIFRRGGRPTFVRSMFEQRRVFEPIDQLDDVVDKLPPRLEGRDLQDIDDLVSYSQREIKALPETIREKVIGTVTPPTQYDRRALQEIRPELERLQSDARTLETDNLTASVRSALLYLGLWLLFLVLIGIVIFVTGVTGNRPESGLVTLLILIGLATLGMITLPFTGRVMENRYTNRLLKVQSEYVNIVSKAADQQLDYSMRLRRDAVTPLTRLVEAQTQIQTEQLTRLQQVDQEMARIEADLNKLGRRGVFGLKT
jgi:GTP-binding protein EngB required for normal cell division